ncbi:TPA: cytochrome c-type biogenesis CcmF C-terminal domain-containing protein [Salmonella enterica]
MMPEYGHALLCLALGVALLLSVYPLWGVARGDARMMASAGVFAWLLFICVAGAFFVLVHAFVVNDFTVAYVAGNSNTQLPVWYRVAATWGAHEGSLLLGVGPLVRWGRDRPRNIRTLLLTALVSTLVLSVLLPWLLEDKIIAMTAVGMAMACWIAVLAVAEAVQRVSRGTKTSLSYWGMVAAHLGLAVTITGIAFSQNYSVERDVRMRAGDSVTIHDYRFTFREVRDITGPNYRGGVALIGVTRHGEPEAVLHAEKRLYNTSRMVMTEAAIDGGLTRDLYAALGEELDNGAWAVRLYYKPFVRWIWAGGLLMALGGLLCLADPRYRRRKPLPEAG